MPHFQVPVWVIANRQGSEEIQTLVNELNGMKNAIMLSNRRAELCETNMEQVIKDSRRKVHEANEAKMESGLRIKNAEHEVTKRFETNRNLETEAIARLRLESSIS